MTDVMPNGSLRSSAITAAVMSTSVCPVVLADVCSLCVSFCVFGDVNGSR